MATDQRVALTRAGRVASGNLPRAAQQVVPAFLQKLYKMVNDTNNDDVIRWSDSGDSFFVLDHERFAREVLGRWFKHQNFASFVRQLNMYGFHKVPHLQQGVLRSEQEVEFSDYEHPHFHRDQPDLLYLIQRKKQIAHVGDENAALDSVRDMVQGQLPAPVSSNLSPGQILDINSIVHGVAAIKRHQTAISAELSELKDSNEHLWQEALAARERHKKHQDMINRILKFLAGVFGHAGAPVQVHKESDSHPSSRAVVPRKSQRLMIADAQPPRNAAHPDKLMVNNSSSEPLYTRSASPPDRFTSIDNTDSLRSATTSSSSLPEFSAPLPAYPSAPAATSDQASASQSITPAATITAPSADSPSSLTLPEQRADLSTSALTPTSESALQATYHQVLSNPAQLQRLLAALGSQQPMFPLPDPTPPPPTQPPSDSQLTTFDTGYDFMRHFNSDINLGHFPQSHAGTTPNSASLLPVHADDTLPHLDPLIDSSDRLHKTYKDTEDINKDVDALHTSIHSFIESLGLDPSLINGPDPGPDHAQQQNQQENSMDVMNALQQPQHQDPVVSTAPEFDFDTLWSQIAPINDESAAAADYNQVFADSIHSVVDPSSLHDRQLGDSIAAAADRFAMLDEVASAASDGTASPSTPSTTTKSTRRRKRKSDVVEMDNTNSSSNNPSQSLSGASTRAKRKR